MADTKFNMGSEMERYKPALQQGRAMEGMMGAQGSSLDSKRKALAKKKAKVKP